MVDDVKHVRGLAFSWSPSSCLEHGFSQPSLERSLDIYSSTAARLAGDLSTKPMHLFLLFFVFYDMISLFFNICRWSILYKLFYCFIVSRFRCLITTYYIVNQYKLEVKISSLMFFMRYHYKKFNYKRFTDAQTALYKSRYLHIPSWCRLIRRI